MLQNFAKFEYNIKKTGKQSYKSQLQIIVGTTATHKEGLKNKL